MGVLLFSDFGDDPNPLNNRLISEAGNIGAEHIEAISVSEIERSAPEDYSQDNRSRESDIVKLVMDFPSGQVLRSGLAFQTPSAINQNSTPVPRPLTRPMLNKSPFNQRQLMDELLPTRERKTPTWRTLLLRTDTRS